VTPLEVASNGLRLRKAKRLSISCESEEKGRGVIADEVIKKDEYICEYRYEIIGDIKKDDQL
jgi:SET domain-containing protein